MMDEEAEDGARAGCSCWERDVEGTETGLGLDEMYGLRGTLAEAVEGDAADEGEDVEILAETPKMERIRKTPVSGFSKRLTRRVTNIVRSIYCINGCRSHLNISRKSRRPKLRVWVVWEAAMDVYVKVAISLLTAFTDVETALATASFVDNALFPHTCSIRCTEFW